MALRLVGLVGVMVLAVGSCFGEPLRMGTLDVWNRTEVPIKVLAMGSDAVLPVAPCDHASAAHFPIGHFVVRDASDKFVAQSGGGGPDPNNAGPLFVVITSDGLQHVGADPPADPLPPCHGDPPVSG